MAEHQQEKHQPIHHYRHKLDVLGVCFGTLRVSFPSFLNLLMTVYIDDWNGKIYINPNYLILL